MKRTPLMYLLTFSLALNAATAATLIFSWWKGQVEAREISFAQEPLMHFLQEHLDLTTDQMNRIAQQIDSTKAEFVRLRSQMDSKRSEMMRLISTRPGDRAAVQAKISEINRTEGELRLLAVGTVSQIVESLPPEARSKFGAYLQERGRICDSCPATERGPFGDR